MCLLKFYRWTTLLSTILGNSIKNGFVLVHISRFKQAIAIHTLQASSQDVKVSKRSRTSCFSFFCQRTEAYTVNSFSTHRKTQLASSCENVHQSQYLKALVAS